jgi:hypothetical protein
LSPRFARPFTLVGGRTVASEPHLAVETLVAATAGASASDSALSLERRDIVRLCRTPQSVAEVAARLHMPFGAARVLVGDLCVTNHLEVYGTAADEFGPDDETLEKVLHALRSR